MPRESPHTVAQPVAPHAPESGERRLAVDRASRGGDAAPRARARRLELQRVGGRAFEVLADNVRDYAIFLLDRAGVIVYWGRSAQLMKWWTRAHAEGAHLRMLYPDGGSDDGTAEDHLRVAAEDGEYTGEGRRVRIDGSTFWGGITLTALRDEAGELLGFAKVTRDLTAQRAAEAVLRAAREAADEARAAAEAANRAKSGFLATMSHEIRTPVNAILGYQDLLELEIGGPLTRAQRDYLERARTSGRHLLAIIDDVLDLSRMEADRVIVEPCAVRVGAVVDAALALVAHQARDRGITIDDAVSGHAAAVVCWADEDRALQILVNLLSNAVKFTPPGGRVVVTAGLSDRPTGVADATGPGPWCYVRVEDTGEGIAADRLDAIFEPFVQADMSHTRVHGGTGLGLAISRRLARLMGGDIVGHSVHGEGSSFFLWLRVAPGVAPHADNVLDVDPRSPHAPPPRAGEASPPPLHALREVADALLRDINRILHACIARLRADAAVPSARDTSERELEDHLSTFLADVANSLTAADLPGTPGTPGSEDLRDGVAIQRVVAARHGRQRARLGWRADEVRREFEILREELSAAVRRRAGRASAGGPAAAEHDALTIVESLVEAARDVSLDSFEQTRRLGDGS